MPHTSMQEYPQVNYASRPRLITRDVKDRLGLFVGGKYAATNLSSVMFKDRKSGADWCKTQMWSAPGKSVPAFEEAKSKLDGGHGRIVGVGVKFGPSYTNHWLKVECEIPKGWSAKDTVELHFDPSCEAMVFDSSGDPLQGITGGTDYNRRIEYIIPPDDVKRGHFVRYIEVTANGMFGLQPSDQADPNVFYTLEMLDLVNVNADARSLSYDFEMLQQLAMVLPEHSPLGNKSRRVANDIMNAFRGKLDDVHRCRELAQEVLGSWEEDLDKEQDGDLWAIGYCHIDTAWLWPWSSTKQKIARSWSSQLDLMDRYPEFRFMATAAQHFRWLEELYPKLFKRLVEKVKSGQFEINGGCWVETDGNVPSGETFCRQFLYGQRYFESRFGKRTDTLILPDTFGFSPSLPQIARLGGCTNYFNNRIGLDTLDKFPYTNFNWVGLDGSQLLSHVTPINRYDSLASVEEIVKGHSNHMNQEAAPDAVLAFGHGDGGGGPRPLLLERLRRVRAAGLAGGGQSEELPLVRQGATLTDYFEHLRKITDNGRRVPDWHGEIYIQALRGTLTSQANTKRNFRKSDLAMREVELFSTLASIQTSFSYPKERIDKVWESLCLCMFHDTIPGSSIRLAVEDYDREFKKILDTTKELTESALKALKGSGTTVVNSLPGVPRHEAVFIDEWQLARADRGELHVKLEPFKSKIEKTDKGVVLTTESLRVTIDKRITSIYDIHNKRELIAPGRTAGFKVFQDHPVEGDAWRVDQYDLDFFDELSFTSCHVSARGIECGLTIGDSKGTVRISLTEMLRLDCDIQWTERHRMLRFELPLSFHSDFATYDAAFGVHRRATTRNTSWDWNKFEVCGHKFADYSEHGYGVALVNDCKYGYAIQGNVMALSLLRAPTEPDGEADQGPHQVSIGVYPHNGSYNWRVQAAAHAFNNPLRRGPALKFATVPFTVDAPNVLLETIKRGEDDFEESYIEREKTVIIRMHEHMGGRALTKLVSKTQITKATLVNVLEDHIEDLDVVTDENEEGIELEFRAFEIKTVRLWLA